jgi:hypothetical protein
MLIKFALAAFAATYFMLGLSVRREWRRKRRENRRRN